MNFLQVGPADAARGNADQQLACADARHGYGFNPHVVDAVIDNGAHGRGCSALCLGIDFSFAMRFWT
jgi:hypothetical protein